MRKFIGLFIKGKPHIYECEVQAVIPPPVSLKEGEHLFKLISPSILNGELYYSFFFSESLEAAKENIEKLLRTGVERDNSKLGLNISEEEVKSQLESIKITLL